MPKSRTAVSLLHYNGPFVPERLKPWFSNCASRRPVRRFNFPRASHKSELSAVLFIELITAKFSAALGLYQRTVAVRNCSYFLVFV